jgi:hypothetical protein
MQDHVKTANLSCKLIVFAASPSGVLKCPPSQLGKEDRVTDRVPKGHCAVKQARLRFSTRA